MQNLIFILYDSEHKKCRNNVKKFDKTDVRTKFETFKFLKLMVAGKLFSLNAFRNLPPIIMILNHPPSGKPLYGVEHSNGGLITFPGGVPIKVFLSQTDR